jgi:hypothetical protein
VGAGSRSGARQAGQYSAIGVPGFVTLFSLRPHVGQAVGGWMDGWVIGLPGGEDESSDCEATAAEADGADEQGGSDGWAWSLRVSDSGSAILGSAIGVALMDGAVGFWAGGSFTISE